VSHGPPADVSPFASDSSAGADLARSSRRGWRGRNGEWDVLAGLLDAAEDSRGGVLLVEGESGMGKSQLLGDAADAAAGRGFILARGAADEPGRLTPLAPLMTALGQSAQTMRAGGTPPPDAVDQRMWLVERLQARLEEHAARGPFLLTLDDLQWADPTTLMALRSLVPELASYPLVWILSRTTGGLESDVDRLYGLLERDGALRIVLAALGDDAVAEIVGDVFGVPPEPGLLALAAGAGGNPFMLVELLLGLRDEDAVEIEDGRAHLVSERLPQRLQEIARSRLSRLPSRTRHLLQVAAVLGRSFDASDLSDMLGEPSSQLLPALEEAATAGVIVPIGDLLTFRHDLLWRAVSGTLTPSVCRALHRQAGEMLLRRGGSAIPAAAHLMRHARPGDTSALAGLDQAMHEVLPSSPQTAAELAVRALDLTDPGDPRRFDRTVTAVFALTTAGRLPEAAEFARSALGQVALPCETARLRYELAYALLLSGRPVQSVAEAEKALSQEDLSSELRGLAQQVLFRGLFASHDYGRGIERARAVVADEESPSQSALVGAHMLLSYAAWGEGRATRGLAHVREAVRITAGDPAQARRAHPRMLLATFLTDMRRFEEAESHLRTSIEEISALGHAAYAASPAIFRGRLRLAEGLLDDAEVEVLAGMAMADEMGMDAFVLVGIAVLTIAAVRRGDIDAAAGHARDYAARHRAGQGAMYGFAWGSWAMALLADVQEGPAKAAGLLRAAYAEPRERRWLLMAEPDAAAWMTRTALAIADRSAAEDVVETARGLAQDNPGFTTLAAAAAHARGILHRDAAALAAAVASHIGPWSRASAMEDLGVLLADRADEESSVDRLDQALAGYQRIGAERDAARVRARLREFGVRRRHWTQSERPHSGWDSLTATERSVAGLVAQGKTNPQVADQMFISPHTVKFHLRQVFRKLGIGSRVELARLAAEHAPEPAPPGA
jgi:DNA-binding CsgD family transcriptional regulator/tetratricopeptide (TPR) repeat protein